MKKNVLFKFTARLMTGIMICSMFFGYQYLNVSAKEGSALDIGAPTFKNTDTLTYYDHGIDYTPDNMLKEIYNADIDAGGDSFYMDRVLERYGVANGAAGSNGNDDGNAFLTRGRALYMKTSNPRIIGFGGDTSYHQPLGKDMYSISFKDGATAISSSEVTASRVNAPSNWASEYTLGTGLKAKVSKFISYENVAVTLLKIENTGSDARQITMDVNSGFVNEKSTVMIDGQEQKELIGTFSSPFNLTTITARLTGDGLEYGASNSVLTKQIDIPAGGSTEVKVVMTFSTIELPNSYEDYIRFSEYDNSQALKAQKAEYNEWWNENIPYIDIPNKAVQKAIDYRWWSERFNSLDANIPGYDYQYPVTIEGVLGYNNAIILTQPMHLQDTKWMRSAYLPYGQLLSAGNSSQSSAFLDNPGNRSNWNNHYGQYLGTAGFEAFNVIGGNADIAKTFAYYFEHDAKGQLDHYGNHDELSLIAYQNNYMTGNDADTISMHYSGAGTWKMHAENAYVYGAANAAKKLYQLIADNTKATELGALASKIQTDILENLWCNQCNAFETRAVSPTGSFVVHNEDQPKLIPLKESNNFNYFSEYVVPTDAESVAKYGEALEYLKYADEFPIFPYYTANQVDNKILSGSNNFSNINFTVQARAYEAALRVYDPTHQYVTPKMLSTMVEWCAWNIFPDAGDVRYPNNNEFFNFDGKTYDNYYRSWIYHNILGNYNYVFVEDMAGLRPRSDDIIELWPIDFDYDYFMVNNLRYHGKDVTIVWDKVDEEQQYGESIPEGYSLYIDGVLVLNVDDLVRVTYDPNTQEVTFPDPENTANVILKASASLPAALDVELDETRVVDMFKKSGIDLTLEGKKNLAEGAAVTASYTPANARAAAWAEKHRADGYDPTSKAVNETIPDPDAVVDGVTVNMPFWGNHDSVNESDWLEIDLGEAKKVDMLNVFFYHDRQTGGYAEPAKYNVQYWNSESNSWEHVQNQARTPLIPAANFNNVEFEEVSTDKIKLVFYNKPGNFTAVTEVQLFSEGGERPEAVNEAPIVSLKVDENKQENMKAYLRAECIDDGIPYDGTLTFTWEVTNKPEDSIVFITGEETLSPTIAASVPGEYTVKFTANDGALSSQASIVITIEELSSVAEKDIALLAEPSSDYTAGWENIAKVNDAANEPTRSNPSTGNGWGNWGVDGGTGSTHYLQYTWSDVVSIDKTEIYWYDDNGGTRAPSDISFQYQDRDGNWYDANMITDFADAKELHQYNTIELEPIFAKALRINCVHSAAGTGILRWKVYSPSIDELLPVYKATKTGVVPVLPDYIYAKLKSGILTTASVVWDAITPEDVASSTSFKVSGINMDTGKFVSADVYVRDDMDVATITDVFSTEATAELGKAIMLPETVKVQYNNGAIDNVSVPVVWDIEEIEAINTVGEHTLVGVGTVEGTGTKATLVLTIVESKVSVSKTALKAKIDETSRYLEINYTEESWMTYQAVLSDAREVYNNPDATQEQVDEALVALIAAIGGLQIKPDEREPELLLHLSFDGNVDDSSSNGYSGALPGTGDPETIWVEGIDGQAINFTGEDTSFEIPAENNLLSPNITVSYWIKRTGELTGDNAILWAKEDSKWNGNGFYTNYPVSGNYSSFFIMDGFNGFYVAENPNDFLPQDQWTHIAVTWNSITKEGAIYKNGIQQATSLEGTPDSISAPEDGTVVNRFGKNGYPSDPQYPTGLQLDDFRIYDKDLDVDAVLGLYNEFMAPVASPKAGSYESAQTVTLSCDVSGTSIYYTLDGSIPTEESNLYTEPIQIVESTTIKAIAISESYTSDVVTFEYRINELVLHLALNGNVDDSSGNGYSGELPGTGDPATIWVEGIDGQAISFTGDDTWLDIPAENNLLSPNITVSYWIRRTDTLTGNNSILWAKPDSTWNGNGFYTNYPVGDNYSSFFIMDGFNGFYVDADPNDFLPQDEWTHIAVTWNSIAKEGAIYKNGIPQAISLMDTPDSISAPEDGTVANRFGKNGYPSDPQYPTGLQLDDFRIYSNNMNLSEVRSLYNAFVDDVNIKVAAPTASPAGRGFRGILAVTLETVTEDARIYFTLDGTQPTIESMLYTGPISLASSTDLKAIAVKAGMEDSDIATFIYTKSRGGTSPVTPTPPEKVIEANSDGTVSIKHTQSLVNGVVESELTVEDIEKALSLAKANEGGEKMLYVEVSKEADVDKYAQILPAAAVSKAEASMILQIETPVANLKIPSNMFKEVETKNNKTVEIVVERVDNNTLDAEVQNLIGDRPVINVYAMLDGQKIEWSNSSAPITIEIDYNPTEEELKNPENIVVYYIDSNNNVITVPSGRYNAETGKVTFVTTHFSNYAIAYSVVTFTDLSQSAWAEKEIGAMAAKGIVEGTSENEFSPRKAVTREEVLGWLVRTLDIKSEVVGSFDDTADSKYAKEIGIAKAVGITNGVGNNKFAPSRSITRQELMTLVDRALDVIGQGLEKGTKDELAGFADALKVAEYAETSVATLIKSGIIIGTSNNNINPLGDTTRAEAAVIMYRLYNK